MAEQATVHEAEAEHAARRQAVPDEAGFFGKYGGQYLPPQLEAPFAEIDQGVPRDRERRRLHRRAALPAQALPGTADAGVPRAHPVARQRRRADLPQARGPQPHRRAQAQPLHGRGPAGQVHGQEEAHRRDRRRPARRRAGHGRGALRPRVRDPHGRGRHREAGAQREPHAAARRHRRAGDARPARRSRRPSTRPSRPTSPTTRTPSTASAPSSARTRSRSWCATSRRSSAWRRASSSSR